MDFLQAVNTCIRKKYVTFSGRASRSEFWWFYLFYVLAFIVEGLLLTVVLESLGSSPEIPIYSWILLGISVMIFLGLLIPLITVSVRRLHDLNYSGWWYLVLMLGAAIPYVGTGIVIVFLVFMAFKGSDEQNRFGPDPLAAQQSGEAPAIQS